MPVYRANKLIKARGRDYDKISEILHKSSKINGFLYNRGGTRVSEIIFSAFFIGLLVLLVYRVYKPKNQYRYNFNVIIVVILWFFAVMRGNGDGDYFGYIEYSKYINSIPMLFNNKFPMEFGFRIIAYFTNLLGLHPQTIFLTMNSIISFTIVYYFKLIEKSQKQLYPLTLILYLYFYMQFDIHATRTGVAMSFGLLFFLFLNKKNYGKATLSIFMASLFHKSSLILIALPLTYILDKKYKREWKIKIFFVTLLVVIIVNIPNLIVLIFKLVGMYKYAFRLTTYLNSEVFGYPIPIYDPRILYFIVVFIYDFYVNRNYDKSNLLSLALQLNIIILLSFRMSTSLSLRLSSYYSFLIIPFFSELDFKYLSKFTDRYHKIVYLLLFFILLGFVIVLKIKLVPYKFFINSMV